MSSAAENKRAPTVFARAYGAAAGTENANSLLCSLLFENNRGNTFCPMIWHRFKRNIFRCRPNTRMYMRERRALRVLGLIKRK
jgi:hypothetical protein